MSAKSRRTTRRLSILPDPVVVEQPKEAVTLPSIEEVAEPVSLSREPVPEQIPTDYGVPSKLRLLFSSVRLELPLLKSYLCPVWVEPMSHPFSDLYCVDLVLHCESLVKISYVTASSTETYPLQNLRQACGHDESARPEEGAARP